MANSWMQRDDERWEPQALTGDAWLLGGSDSCLHPGAAEDPQADVLLLRVGGGRAERWVLLARRDRRVTVNGDRLELGLRELRDRDEILIAGRNGDPSIGPPHRFFYTNERLARIEPLPTTSRPVYCVRCKQLIEVDSPAVACPSQTCGLWHHQSSELPCWEYAESCAACDQPTDLNVGFRWTPAEL